MMRRVLLAGLSPAERRALVRRSAVPEASIRRDAAAIVEDVRLGGDAALAAAGARFGGARPGGTRVPSDEIAAAVRGLEPRLATAILTAISNVRRVHERQRPSDHSVEVMPGVEISRRWAPLRRVGCYVPGGSAPLPSTLIMTVVPARVAGVASIAVATPAGADGAVDPSTLAAAGMLGIEEVHAMGGAQAVAAFAFGTESVAPVDRIVGPGNAWVTAAKLAVSGVCSIDMPAGPSEALILADSSADPRLVAADLLSQAEHGPDSPVLLVSTDERVIDAVLAEAEKQLSSLERREVIAAALAANGIAVLAPDLASAAAFADEYGPEHLSIFLADAEAVAEVVTSAGSVFLGPWAPEAVGDYASGANHVLPTGGLARSMSPLGVEDFGSWRQVQRLTRDGLAALRDTAETLAAAEGLTAHRAAIRVRFEEDTP
jgi:histidinol dehydrogenase